MSNFEQLSPREAYAAYMLGSILVDVRESADVQEKAADLKQLKVLPFSELDQRLDELPTNRQVVFVSRIGIKSKQAAELLIEKGFDKVATVKGGLTAWEADGFPIRNSA
ncbi:MAG: rhodanese-like domain-containing protein [Saprospiraceae bacterium]